MENYSISSEPQPAYKLLPGEELVDVTEHALRLFSEVPSSKEQLLRLTRARDTEEIGKYGPSVASLAFDVSAQTSVPSGESPLHTPESPLPAPEHLRLYEAVFGRDSLRVAIDLVTSYPELARGTTLRLAELQGVTYNIDREEEPGRIVHEAREETDPVARELSQRLGWGWPYYGSVDATPEFIRTLTAYCRRTEENNAFLSQEYIDRSGTSRSMAYALDMAVTWIERRLDSNQEGIVEYRLRPPKNAVNREWTDVWNQVWKDSWDAYHHADGSIANHNKGIASLEVQVTAFDALIDAAHLYENVLDDTEKATSLRRRATLLKEAIFTHFWTEEKGGYFVLGTDRDDNGNLRQMKIRTSNMGHALNSRLLEDDDPRIVRMREQTIAHLLSPEMLNVSGIRTLASDEARFRPGAYHNGSVWLWDTHHIAKGFRRHGYEDIATDLDVRMLNVIETTKIFPEYVRGDHSDTPSINHRTIRLWDEANQRYNKVEQPPQEVQAWTVAAILAIKKRMARRGVFTA